MPVKREYSSFLVEKIARANRAAQRAYDEARGRGYPGYAERWAALAWSAAYYADEEKPVPLVAAWPQDPL